MVANYLPSPNSSSSRCRFFHNRQFRLDNKAITDPRSAARFKLKVNPRRKLTKCLEYEEQLK